MTNREKELSEALNDALDVAMWLTGCGDLSKVEGWPQMREKLMSAMARSDRAVIMDGDEMVGVALL